jgi:hypothetical protein
MRAASVSCSAASICSTRNGLKSDGGAPGNSATTNGQRGSEALPYRYASKAPDDDAPLEDALGAVRAAALRPAS